MRRTPLSRGLLTILLLSLMACRDEPTSPPLDQLFIESDLPVLAIGDTITLTATGLATEDRVFDPTVNWQSDDPEVATVDRSGIVTGVGRGKVRIIGESGGASASIQLDIISDRYNVRTDEGCSDPDYRVARVVAVGKHAIVIADTANPAGGLDRNDYQAVVRTFDELVHPVVTEHFGEPSDIDDNGRVIIFYTRAVNEMTPRGSPGYIGGFFFGRDLFPKSDTPRFGACPASNEAEIFYVMVADPRGQVNGNIRSRDLVRRNTLGIIAHEYQHLINSSRRMYVNGALAFEFERIWVNEALSHISEELVFYSASGLAPRQNIDLDRLFRSQRVLSAYNNYQINNLARLYEYFQAPESFAAYSDSARLGDRGAGWHYFRYLADRTRLDEGDLWFSLTNSTRSGFDNLAAVTGLSQAELIDHYRDWAITAYTDDLIDTDARFQFPSWDHHVILDSLDLGGIEPLELEPGEGIPFTLHGGGSAYFTFEAMGGTRAEIRLTRGGAGSGPGACTDETPPIILAEGDVFAPPAGEVETLCVESGESGGRYAVVITDPVLDIASSRELNLVGYGIESPQGTAGVAAGNSLARQYTLSQFRSETEPVRDHSFGIQLRMQEERELTPLLGGSGRGDPGARISALLQAVPEGPSEPYISLIRLH